MRPLSRMLLVLAGLICAAGVAAAAGGSHGGSRNLSAMAMMFLAHAPVLVAVALAGRAKMLEVTALALACGTILFGADLATRELLGQGAFPGAAPLGGGIMILSWIGLAAAGLRGSVRS